MSKPLSPDAVRDVYAALPPAAQQSVADFLAFLSSQAPVPAKRRAARQVPLSSDPAIGQWRDRTDMADSVEYVRALRRKHWGHGE